MLLTLDATITVNEQLGSLPRRPYRVRSNTLASKLSRNFRSANPEKPFKIELHGDEGTDPYFWLRESDNPEVLKFLTNENQKTENVSFELPVRGEGR